MKNVDFPIWQNLESWGRKENFYRLVFVRQDKYPTVRNILEFIIPILYFFKSTLYHETLKHFNDSMFSRFWSYFIYQSITLEFIGAKYIALITFSFGIFFSAFLVYYHCHYQKMLMHHTASIICFILQEISPILGFFSSSALQIVIVQCVNHEVTYVSLYLAISSFIMCTYFTYRGTIFHRITTVRESVCHSFWYHIFYFGLYFSNCLLQQSWILISLFKKGLFYVLITNTVVHFGILIWLFTFPYFTVSSNIGAFRIVGHICSALIVSILYHIFHFPDFMFVCIGIFLFIAWRTIFCKLVYAGVVKFYSWALKNDLDNLFDLDNIVQIPNHSPTVLTIIIHYLKLIKFPELTPLLIAIIDAGISDELTLECAKVLYMSSTIPRRIREKLFQIDKRNLSFLSRPFLLELQFEMNKLMINHDDIETVTNLLDEENQMTKIALYAFTNSICDSHFKKSKMPTLINYAMQAHRFELIANYAIEGNPQSTEILNMYRDFISKYSGNFLMSEKISAQSSKSNYQLIQMQPSDTLDFDKKPPTNNADISMSLSRQKALDIIPVYPLQFVKIIGAIMVISLIFPIFTTMKFVESSSFVPYKYFANEHSPSFFMLSLSLDIVDMFFVSFNDTLFGRSETLLEVPYIFYTTVQQYIEKFTCPIDNKPVIINGSAELVDEFYDMVSIKYLRYTTDPNGWLVLRQVHERIEKIHNHLLPIIERYNNCAQNMPNYPNLTDVWIFLCIDIFLVLALIIVTPILVYRYMKKIIAVLEGIELATIEEFRSNLYVQISKSKRSESFNEFEIDNEGVLELEEIEADDRHYTNNRSDYTEIIDQALNAPILMKRFDPGRLTVYLTSTFLIFVCRYFLVFLAYYILGSYRDRFIDTAVMIQDKAEHMATLFIEMDALMANLTGEDDGKSIYPQHVILHSDHKYSNDFVQLIDEWNAFIDTKNITVDSAMYVVLTISEKLVIDFLRLQKENNIKIEESSARFVEFVYWLLTCFLISAFSAITFRFVNNTKHIFLNARHIVLVLHSKYSSTESVLINNLTPQIKFKKDVSFKDLSQTIVSQMHDPIIFFNTDLIISGCNQQAAADFGYTEEKMVGLVIEKIFEENANEEFFSFVCAMFTPMGVIAKRTFNIIGTTRDSTNIEYSAILIPLKTRGILSNFALLMRNMTEIIEMRHELNQLKNNLNVLVRRLFPPPYVSKFIDGSLENVLSASNCSVLCATTKLHFESKNNESQLNESDVTEIVMSLMDRIVQKYKDIIRIRSLNGVFVFVAGFQVERSTGEIVQDLIDFIKECAEAINRSFEYNQVLCGVIKSGGPCFAYLSGITKTVFEMWSEPLMEAFDMIDIVPPGKILMTQTEYEAIDRNESFVVYHPQRDVKFRLYINNDYIGMDA